MVRLGPQHPQAPVPAQTLGDPGRWAGRGPAVLTTSCTPLLLFLGQVQWQQGPVSPPLFPALLFVFTSLPFTGAALCLYPWVTDRPCASTLCQPRAQLP